MEIKDFLDYLTADRKMSDNTVGAYRQDITAFSKFLEGRGIGSMAEATNTAVVAYLMDLKNSGKSSSTVSRKLASIRAYYRFLVNKGIVKVNPTEDIKAPKISRNEISYFTIEEIEKLLDMPDDSTKGKRDRAILEVLYATGIRASEIIELRVSSINLRMGFVTCNGDHGKARIVPIGSPARKALEDYLGNSRPAYMRNGDAEDNEGMLFVNYVGEPLTRQGLWKILKQYGGEAGLTEITPQMIRNSFAMHMVQNGIDLKSLQELMGHEDILATEAYYEHNRSSIKDAYDKTHPRA